ncbi:MYND-type domain-containing protein [Favolaschia claudopus]|uniref:MYND-type domain-containing protein n=1 Tax=Favolaschia claudopus TaxID=2862362 RepID=A0AAW0DF00_9AGAR
MHDILHGRNIFKLPDHIRASHLSAAEGSLENLHLVSEAIVNRSTKFRSQPSALHLLPVFYKHVDPSLIPAQDEIDAIISSRTRLHSLDAAIISLKSLSFFTELPVFSLATETCPYLWARIWPWLKFFHTFWEYLPGLDPTKEDEAIACHCFLIARLRTHPKVQEISSEQPGLHCMLAQGWTKLVLDTNSTPKLLLAQTSTLLPALINGFTLPEVFEEAVDGARGSIKRLASAVLKQMSIIMTSAIKDEAIVTCIVSALHLLTPPRSPRRTEWVSILLHGGIIPCIVSLLRTLVGTPFTTIAFKEYVDHAAKEGFNNLRYYMTIPPGYPWIVEALQAGLLRDLVSYTISGAAYPGPDYIADLIGPNLPPGSLSDESYMSGLLPLSLDEAKTLANDPRFRKSPTFAAWQNLLESTKSRMEVVDGWESAGKPSFLACHSMTCGKIERKSRFKCCSGCQSANYCSAECQSADWANGHREICNALCHDRASQPELVNTRDRSFMRALLHHDYQRYLLDVPLREIRFMRDSPGQEYVVIFDYTQAGGRVHVKVDSKSAYFEGAGVLGAELRVQLQRFTRSGGRMAMHFMHLVEGMKNKGRLIPLRAARSDLHDGLVEIAKSSPFGRRTREETLHDEHRVEALIRKTSQLPVIH